MLYRVRPAFKKEAHTFFASEACHPQTLAVLDSRAEPMGIVLRTGKIEELADPDASVFGVLLPYPDTYGAVRDDREIICALHEEDIRVAVVADLLALTLFRSPGSLGADVVVGSTQRLGVPMGYGGPHAAYFATLAVIAALPMAKNWTTRWAAPTGIALALLVLTIGFWPGVVLIKGHNPFTQVRGWPQTIARISALAKQQGVSWVATDAYGLTGQLSHYLTPMGITVRSVTAPERYLFLPEIPAAFCHERALFISRKSYPDGVGYFVLSQTGPEIIRQDHGTVLMRYWTATVSGMAACRS